MRSFEYGDLVTLSLELVCARQARDPRAKNHSGLAATGRYGSKIRPLDARHRGHEAETHRDVVHSGRTTYGSDQMQKSAARDGVGHVSEDACRSSSIIQGACQPGQPRRARKFATFIRSCVRTLLCACAVSVCAPPELAHSRRGQLASWDTGLLGCWATGLQGYWPERS